jgi:hypothetical protein
MSRFLGRALFVAALVGPGFFASTARADGCYICTSGSSEICKNYCRYSEDTFAARKECEKRGCKIGGTASCPAAANVKICLAPTNPSNTTVASLPWCVAETRPRA